MEVPAGLGGGTEQASGCGKPALPLPGLSLIGGSPEVVGRAASLVPAKMNIQKSQGNLPGHVPGAKQGELPVSPKAQGREESNASGTMWGKDDAWSMFHVPTGLSLRHRDDSDWLTHYGDI